MTGPSGVSCGTIFILETSHLIILLIECYRHMMHDEWVHHWSQTLKTDTSIWTFVVQTCLDSFISEPVEIPVNEVHEIIKSPSFPVSFVEDFVFFPSNESFTYRCVKRAIQHELIIHKVTLLISILSNVIEHCVTFFMYCWMLFKYCKTLFLNRIT